MRHFELFFTFLVAFVAGQDDGKTTRYWDCCKPSCSWAKKAPVSNPVLACAIDGETKLTNASIMSGCAPQSTAAEDAAYSCSDNQPWAIDDTLSYGFAAAHIAGETERDWCCTCYELTFTSGAVEGRKMIVQVTNTGGDLGDNQFDLQIPGGGVGIFNGCDPQWASGEDGWGDRYGGVSSSEDCDDLLPEALQAGCKWRFDWFQNSDNPTVSFVKVDCPDELITITNCIHE